jgi:IclR family transcriptional regulator, KDG regulon repressor
MEKLEKEKSSSLSTVKNALNILRSFSMDEPEQGVREMSQLLGMPRSTVQRLLATLASEGFLEQNPSTKKYRLGIPFLSLSTIVTSHFDAFKEFYPVYKEAADKLGETIRSSTLAGTQVVQVYAYRCKYPCRSFNHIGRYNPIHCTSAGKVLLANSNEEIIENVIQKGLKRYTKYTKTDPHEFRAELKKVREQGYSISIEEFGIGGISVAAPVHDYSGKVNFAIDIVSTVDRINRHNISNFIEEIKKTAGRISDICRFYEYSRRW